MLKEPETIPQYVLELIKHSIEIIESENKPLTLCMCSKCNPNGVDAYYKNVDGILKADLIYVGF